MSKPIIAAKKPIVETAAAGTYWWCACGRSANQPFCDGSHEGTEFTPVEVTLDSDTRIAWCTCKHTGNGPRCDGSHKNL